MKTIQLSDSNWKYLQNLRVDYNLRSLNDVVDKIVTKMKKLNLQKELNKIKFKGRK